MGYTKPECPNWKVTETISAVSLNFVFILKVITYIYLKYCVHVNSHYCGLLEIHLD